jgi:hypothetical protein
MKLRFGLITIIIMVIIASFQNCGKTDSQNTNQASRVAGTYTYFAKVTSTTAPTCWAGTGAVDSLHPTSPPLYLKFHGNATVTLSSPVATGPGIPAPTPEPTIAVDDQFKFAADFDSVVYKEIQYFLKMPQPQCPPGND